MVVEDEWLVRMEIADALSEAGWNVIELATAAAAVDLLAQDLHIDLLITDVRLPGQLSGWDLAEKYRAARTETVVIYCSGNPPDKARQVPGSTFLVKPCRLDLIFQAVDAATASDAGKE